MPLVLFLPWNSSCPWNSGEGPVDMDAAACGVKRAMIERAERRLLLVDQGKFGVRSLQLVCPLDELDDVIADARPEPALRKALAAADVVFHLASS